VRALTCQIRAGQQQEVRLREGARDGCCGAPARPRGDWGSGLTELGEFREPTLRLGLLRGFELRRGGDLVPLPLSAQRVVAFLALHDRPLQRLHVAGTLWLDATEARANASLRTALWRLGRPSCRLVEASTTHVALADDVAVDVRDAKTLAESVIDGGTPPAAQVLYRAGEILPDWYEDWVLIEREHFRQLRLHALEALCVEHTAAGRFGEATQAGLAAVEGEPLRESAHRVLIAAHLAEGNPGEALRQYRFFARILKQQLDLEPSHLMNELMNALPSR
jgi:DNA-binding SARP family transcriptional activator